MAEIFCLHPIRYPPSSRQTSHEEGKEWLRSHSTGGLQDTGSPLSPPGTTSTNTGKYHYSNLRMLIYIYIISDVWFSVVEPTFHIIPWTNIIKSIFLCHPDICVAVSPTNMSQYNLPSTSMSRSNSIPAQDSFELYGEGHTLGGSATSLEERPHGISRSGSFRNSTDEG